MLAVNGAFLFLDLSFLAANKFKLYQDTLPADKPRIPVVHLPKTIDNDYMGIDFTFGYFTTCLK